MPFCTAKENIFPSTDHRLFIDENPAIERLHPASRKTDPYRDRYVRAPAFELTHKLCLFNFALVAK